MMIRNRVELREAFCPDNPTRLMPNVIQVTETLRNCHTRPGFVCDRQSNFL